MKRLNQLTQSINSFIPTRKDPWWGLPLALFGLAVCCAMASLLVYPEGTPEELWLLGL